MKVKEAGVFVQYVAITSSCSLNNLLTKQSWYQGFTQKYFLKGGEEKKNGAGEGEIFILNLRPHQSHTKASFKSLLTHHILRHLKKHIHFLAPICFKGAKPCKAKDAEGNGRPYLLRRKRQMRLLASWRMAVRSPHHGGRQRVGGKATLTCWG